MPARTGLPRLCAHAESRNQLEAKLKTLITLAIAAAVALIGVVGYALSGWHNVGASVPHSSLANWLLGNVSQASIERRARQVAVPDLSDPNLALAGANDFASMCAGCHGAPGQSPEAVGQGLNPPAPDLAESAAHLSSAELFWVTKHGIRMTGMPSWGATHDDEALWPVVAFMRKLPELDAEKYQGYLARAGNLGHHGGTDQAAHNHGDKDHTDASMHEKHNKSVLTGSEALPGEEAGHDHSTHTHEPPKTKTVEEPEHDHSSHKH